ncbi:MAG: 4Fe-4S dicluster domain-containing protein [Candidatus Omnitrophota bacterium]
MKLPCLFQFRILKEAVKAAITGPYTSKFPFKPHVPSENFRGKPEYSEVDCMGCSACAQVCPAGAITFSDEIDNGKATRKFVLRHDICIFCGQCQANCPTEKGVKLTQEFDLAVLENRRQLVSTVDKELVLCECCNEIIAPKDQIVWVAKRLGPLTFSNASLMLFYLKEMSLSNSDKMPALKEHSLNRADRIRVLCPKCRREAILKS